MGERILEGKYRICWSDQGCKAVLAEEYNEKQKVWLLNLKNQRGHIFTTHATTKPKRGMRPKEGNRCSFGEKFHLTCPRERTNLPFLLEVAHILKPINDL